MNFLKKYIAISVLLCQAAVVSNAQDKDLPKSVFIAAEIPDALKQNANSVVRYSVKDINVKSPDNITVKDHSVITVLNEKAKDEATVILGFSRKFNSVSNFEMRIYDASGKLLKKYHKGDMYERSAISNSTILSDERLVAIAHPLAIFPCTVEIIIEENFKSSINIGSWAIQDDEQAVQSADCHVTINDNAGFRFLAKDTDAQPIKVTNEGRSTYSWHLSNLPAIKIEDNAKAWRVLPRIYFDAGKFTFYGTDGDISTWQNFGSWIQTLNSDVCTLSPTRAAEIQKMTANLKTDKEKVKFLYEYMQKSMRYVSIQLGIGGMKPFTADFVDEKKYGDCKALSNYMYALLKAVDIPSNYAIINAGANAEPAEDGFPRNGFNHAILCVPLKGDTTWLECTSSTNEFGKLGSFTENRKALLITEQGGKLVNTPLSKPDDNRLNADVQVKLNADGSAKALVKIASRGDYRNDFIEIAYLKQDEQKEALISLLKLKEPQSIDFETVKDENGIREVKLNIDYDKLCEVMAGSKLFYRPRVFDLWKATVPPLEERKSDFYFSVPLQKSCTTTIDLPDGFEVETLPSSQNLKFTYGSYDVKYQYDAAKNQVVNITTISLNKHVIPAAKYAEMQQYMDNIAKAQNKKLVIRKKA